MKKKIDYGNIVGKCKVCGINMYDKYDNKPAIWPCGIIARTAEGKTTPDCPYETETDRLEINKKLKIQLSEHGSSISQLIESSD